MNDSTGLIVTTWVAAGLLSVAAILNFLDGAPLPGVFQALGGALFAVTGVIAHGKRRGRNPSAA